MNAASELKEAVNDQQNEIEYMRKRDHILSDIQNPQRMAGDFLPSDLTYHSAASYEQEIVNLKALVSSMRAEQMRREHSDPAQDLESALLHLNRVQDEMRQLISANEAALRDQANFHQQELEDLHFDMQNLEVVVQDQNLKMEESLTVTQQAQKQAIEAETELKSIAEEKEFMMLQIDVSPHLHCPQWWRLRNL